MPVYMLTDDLVFPPPEGASPEGVVAVGGDASPERLVLAYSQGIFPWPHEDLPLLWFSPDPRFVLPIERVHVGRSLRRRIRAGDFEVRADSAFDRVIEACAAAPRPGQDGTWITDELKQGFAALHRRGYAHSIETYLNGELVGGLYGIAIGSSFCGESMFSRVDDASKVATVTLLGNLAAWGFHFVDCQVHTEHLARFGAEPWPRPIFLGALRRAIAEPARPGPWQLELGPEQALEVLLTAVVNSSSDPSER
ncbi:MAG: leucyl/phenylalanyl-tRNA--protein transferase [Myxococcales bacterium]|nr:leucyl/phenylalanyl-tRNA--protein transferase [Myxococcales bacterium]